MKHPSSAIPEFGRILQDYFCQRLIHQRNSSARTVSSYRDTFRLLFRYMEERLKRPPETLVLTDLSASVVLGFLDHLEKHRRNSIRSRNARLAAVRSFLKYAILRDPTALPAIQQILAIPMKRFTRPLVGFLSREEMRNLMEAPDPETWSGLRDQVMFATMYNTGARVSEIATVRVEDVTLNSSNSIRFQGKGRKERSVPLWKNTALKIQKWIRTTKGVPGDPLFPGRNGRHLTRSGIADRLRSAVRRAENTCPSLLKRRISPHVLRHTTAMHLFQAGVDLSVIALWLGHESIGTTHMYMEADLKMKERALKKLQEPSTRQPRYRTTDRMLAFLQTL